MDPQGFNVSWGSLWKVFFMILFVAILFVSREIFIALFLAIVISSALEPTVSRLEKKKIPRILSTLGIYIVAIFVVAMMIYTVVPLAISELRNLLEVFGGKLSGTIFEFIDASSTIETLKESLTKIGGLLFSGGTSLVDISSRFLGGLTFTVSVFVLSFYLTMDRDGVARFLETVMPSIYENRILDLYSRVRRKIGRWFTGQIFLSFTIGLLVFLAMTLLGVKYALVLGILAAFLEVIPYVGPIFSGGLAVLLALSTSFSLGIYALIAFMIIQQLENNLLVPTVTHLTTSLNPVVTLIALLIGAKVFGFVGLILAVPAAVLLQEVIEDWSSSKQKRRGLGL